MVLASTISTPAWAQTDAGRPSSVDAPKADRFIVPWARFDVGKLEHDRIGFGPEADGDGVPDLVLATGWDVDGFASLTVVSSKTGQPCFCRKDYVGLLPSRRESPVALTWEAGGDVDGDGVHDILLGIPDRSLVALLSGKDGQLLRVFRGKAAGFGAAFSIGPDIDGDGKSDVAIGSPGARLVQLFSGSSGRKIDSWNAPTLEGFGRLVVLRAFHGQQAVLAIASGSQSYLFDPKGNQEPLFIFGDLQSREAPTSLSLASDVDGDGFRDFVTAWGKKSSGVFSIRSRKLLGFHDAAPFADVDGDGKVEWLPSVARGPLMFATDDGAPPSRDTRNLKALMPVPTTLSDEIRQDRWAVDESGRHLLTWSDDGGTLTLHTMGARAPAPSVTPPLVPVAPVECPLLFGPDANFPPEVEAALLPTLSLLAKNLEAWSQASPPRFDATLDKQGKAKAAARHAAAGLALARMADPRAGLWFWENSGVVSTPTVRFPPSSRQDSLSYPMAMAADAAASELRTALGKPELARAITRSPLAIADLLRNLDDRDFKKRLDRKLLRTLPIQAKIRLTPTPGGGDDPWSLEIYLTVRGKRLYVAHVIYHDGSA